MSEAFSGETEGAWAIDGDDIRGARGLGASPPAQKIPSLTYSNPFGQEVERVWFDGRAVFALEAGKVEVDPGSVKVAQEYQVVYDVELGDDGRPVREPELVPGQLNIYDSVPGMDNYSPLWQFNYVLVPRDYEANSLRSERDCLESDYPTMRSNVVEN